MWYVDCWEFPQAVARDSVELKKSSQKQGNLAVTSLPGTTLYTYRFDRLCFMCVVVVVVLVLVVVAVKSIHHVYYHENTMSMGYPLEGGHRHTPRRSGARLWRVDVWVADNIPDKESLSTTQTFGCP